MKTFFSIIGIGLLVLSFFLLGWREIAGIACLLFGFSCVFATGSEDFSDIIETAKRSAQKRK